MPVLDDLARRLLHLLADEPGVGVLGASRRLGVARATVQARLDRLRSDGVIADTAPTLSPAALGFPVTAFCTLAIRQRRGYEPITAHLAAIPQVLEVHTITGDGDVLVRVAARDNTDLQRVLDQMVADPQVVRASTVISLAELLPHRTRTLIDRAAQPS